MPVSETWPLQAQRRAPLKRPGGDLAGVRVVQLPQSHSLRKGHFGEKMRRDGSFRVFEGQLAGGGTISSTCRSLTKRVFGRDTLEELRLTQRAPSGGTSGEAETSQAAPGQLDAGTLSGSPPIVDDGQVAGGRLLQLRPESWLAEMLDGEQFRVEPRRREMR